MTLLLSGVDDTGFETTGWLVVIGGETMLVDDEIVYVGFVMLVVCVAPMLTVTGSDGTDDERVIGFPPGVKTLAANPRICVKSPDVGVVGGVTVLGGAAVVVAEVGAAKSLAGVNTLLIEPTNGVFMAEDVTGYTDVMTLDVGTAIVAGACVAAYVA